MAARCTAAILLSALLSVSSARIEAQSPAPADTMLPATGVDFSGIDRFWELADLLAKDIAPTEAQWTALLSTPGYRLAAMSLGTSIRENIEIALKPSRRADFDSLTAIVSDRASTLRHIARAPAFRRELDALRDSLARTLPVEDARKRAQEFLPPGATRNGAPPLVAFAIFRNDAYAQRPGIVFDLLHALENGVGPTLAHELHHTYLGRLVPARSAPASDADDAILASALLHMRNEGIADLIDKPYPLSMRDPALARYVQRYNDEYARTPATLRAIDSLLAIAADDSTALRAVGVEVRRLLWSAGHPNGAFVARTILETFGVDSLFPAVYTPAAFLRTYAAAERQRRNPPPFSAGALQVIERLERRYWTVPARAR